MPPLEGLVFSSSQVLERQVAFDSRRLRSQLGKDRGVGFGESQRW